MGKYVCAADAFVIPCLSEDLGFSALEACNANKVVVVTNAGSLPEIVFGKHVFVESGSAQSLAEGCMRAYSGEVSSKPAKMFRWEQAVEDYLQVYQRLMSKKG